jgi:hypothetical protein
MYIDKKEAIETLQEIEKLEYKIGRFKLAESVFNFIKIRQLKKDLEPANVGVKTIDVNERDYLMIRALINKNKNNL